MSIVIRGDTEYWDIPVVDTQGNPYPLYNCSVWVTVKRSPDDPDTEAVYQHYVRIGAGGEVEASKGITLGPGGVAAGIVTQKLTPEESKALMVGEYTYDVQIMLENGDIKTPVRGATETVEPDWTRATVAPEVVGP